MSLFSHDNRSNDPVPPEEQVQDDLYEGFSYNSYQQIQERRNRRAKTIRIGAIAFFLLFLLTLAGNLSLIFLYRDVRNAALEGPPEPPPVEQPQQPPVPGPNHGDYTLDLLDPPDADIPHGVVVTDVTQVVDTASASVVGIISESYVPGYAGLQIAGSSTGTGIILSEDGYIVTNHHVIDGGTLLTVMLNDGRSFPASLVGSDAQMDLAVLKIEAEKLVPAQFGNSDEVKVGQAAIAIGNPGGMDLLGTTTYGIISGVNRSVEIGNFRMNLLQTDASINPGNSGGSLLNQYGQVIGVTNAKLAADGYEGIGFAIPINEVKPIVEELVRQGYVSGRPVVGLSVSAMSSLAASFYGYPRGLYVDSVSPDSDAYNIGIRAGDIITQFEGQDLRSVTEACEIRNEHEVGDTIKLTLYRNRVYYEAEVELEEQGLLGGDYNF